jgi:hypothetical protein
VYDRALKGYVDSTLKAMAASLNCRVDQLVSNLQQLPSSPRPLVKGSAREIAAYFFLSRLAGKAFSDLPDSLYPELFKALSVCVKDFRLIHKKEIEKS